jgi:hypothetical protein
MHILKSVLEPFDSLVALDLVGSANLALAATAFGNTLTGSGPIACQHHLFPV